MSDCKHCPTRARMGYHDGIYADMLAREQHVCDPADDTPTLAWGRRVDSVTPCCYTGSINHWR